MDDDMNILFIPVLLTIVLTSMGCKTKDTSATPGAASENPNRCVLTDVGEAADFMQKKDITDDALVVAHGLGNPQALVWREAKINKTFYLARVMGTEKRLYFLREIPEGETPGIPSRFEGHLLRWDHLPHEKAQSMAGGLKSQYGVTFDPSKTYIILQGEKPKGCR